MINTIISKPKLTSEEKKKKIQELFEYHIPTLMKQPGLIEPIFIPKMAYKPAGKDEKHVTFFASEIEKAEHFETPKDIFIEFISNEYNSEDPKRTLYKWRFNPHWRTEYDTIPATDTIQERYMIPVAELRIINKVEQKQEEPKKISMEFELVDDAPFNMLTIRDLAAIMLKKPVSQKQWLNDLIKQK